MTRTSDDISCTSGSMAMELDTVSGGLRFGFQLRGRASSTSFDGAREGREVRLESIARSDDHVAQMKATASFRLHVSTEL